MGIGQRLLQLLGGGRSSDEGDPGAMREAAVVQLVIGPMLVERLRDRGIEATGIESVDPVTGVRSDMRIMVRQADLPAARRALDEGGDEPAVGVTLDNLTGTDEDGDEAAEAAAQQAMSGLFLAADRLVRQPGDVHLVTEVEALHDAVAGAAPPFGVEPLAWERVASLAAAVVSAHGAAAEDEVRAAAKALRDFLRVYV